MYVEVSEQILDELHGGAKSVPAIVRNTGLEADEIQRGLDSLEVASMVKQHCHEAREDIAEEVTRWHLVPDGGSDSFVGAPNSGDSLLA